MYRLPSEEEAINQLEIIGKNFITSRSQIKNEVHPSLNLWIKGYGISEADELQGMIGQFAIISYKKLQDHWVLYATELPTDIKLHPQRKQIKRDNPNWGHPVLRSIRKGKVYKTLAEAESELALLHKEFPKVSIPNPNKLYIMIYCSDRPAKERMVKHIITIKPAEDGSYILNCEENKPRLKKPKTQENQQVRGYFTAKVALGRKAKKKKPRPTE